MEPFPELQLNVFSSSYKYLPPSLTAVTVNPALVLPNPVVMTDRLLNFAANFKN